MLFSFELSKKKIHFLCRNKYIIIVIIIIFAILQFKKIFTYKLNKPTHNN